MNFRWARKLVPVIGCLLGVSTSAFAAGSSDIMFQGFDWNSGAGWYGTVQSDASTLQAAGFTMVWLPPPTASADTHGYLPTMWYDLNDSSYGNQSALVSCINTLHGDGMKALADIVVQHRNGDLTGGADFSNPVFGEGQGSTDTSNPNNARAVCDNDPCGCGTGAPDTYVVYTASRNLDHTWSTTQSTIETWMNWLKSSIGFDGWRFDMCTGYAPAYPGLYSSSTSSYFSVGEFWDTSTTDEANWVSASGISAFDFATKNTLDSVFNNSNYTYLDNNGAAPGLIGVNPAKAVDFVDDHDTAATGGQDMLPMPASGMQQAYVYVLTHPGVPMVFWDEYFSNESLINTLISIRKQQGITSTSSLSIQSSSTGLYAAIINGNTAMKIGPNAWTPTGNWTLATSGTNYAVWTLNGTQTQTATPSISPASGTYGAAQSVTISDSTSSATIYYTTNGTTPTTSSSVYSGAITVPAGTTETIEAIAQASGDTVSNVASVTIAVNSGGGTGSLTGTPTDIKSSTSDNLTTLGTSDWAHWGLSSASSFNHKLSGNSQIGNASVVGSGSFAQFTDSIQEMSWTDGTPTTSASSSPNGIWIGGVGDGFSFTAPADTNQRVLTVYVGGYQSDGTLTASLSDGSASTYTDSSMSGSGTGTDGSHFYGVYTLTYKAASAGQTITVKWTENANQGSGNVTLQAATLTGGSPIASTPTFSPAAGTYSAAQSVAISDSTSGATIYYTTNGTTPTTSSTIYSGPITVSSTETIEAIAAASGYSNSAVGSAAYTITQPVAPTPVISPATGTYTSSQTVTITDSLSGSTIYYTTNGTTPTTSSTQYTGSFSVSSTETVEAIAAASGYTNSPLATSAITIGGGMVAVTFEIQNCNTTFGQQVYVVGNISQLGNWTPASGFLLTIQGSGANVPWEGTVNLPASTAIQYKYVKWNGSTAVWEANQNTSSGNRQQTTPASGSVTYNDGNF